MNVTESGIYNDSRFVQLLKALSLIFITEFGIIILCRFAQLLKA